MSGEKKFVPPAPVGEPYRADPTEPAPFADGTAPATFAPAPPLISDVPAGVQTPRVEQDLATRPQFQTRGAQPQAASAPRPPEKMAKIALWVGIASIVISPLLGPVAIVMGAVSINRGEKKLGSWALATGVAGTVIGLTVLILVLTGVMPNLDQLLEDIRERNR